MPLPDFTNKTLFPPFNDLPPSTAPAPASIPPPEENEQQQPPTLLATIKDDMTITKPTLICVDREATPFALVFEGYDRESGIKFLKSGGFKKGSTVVLRGGVARKVAPSETSKSGRAFMSVAIGREFEVGVLGGGGVDRIFEIVGGLRGRGEEGEGGEGKCDGCGGGEGGKLLKCTGCGVVRYCTKECQVKGWTEGRHKADCKVIKGVVGIWGR